MLNLITLSWVGYLTFTVIFIYASWRILFFLPLTLRLGILFSQMAILFIPAKVDASALAPVFIVLIINLVTSIPVEEVTTKAMPLVLGLIAAWLMAILLGWLIHKKRLAKQEAAAEAATSNQSTTPSTTN